MNVFNFIKSRSIVAVVSSVIISFGFVAFAVNGATTISTNISTGGTLSVTGLSTLLGGATTTTLTLLNGEVISNATDGTIQLGGIASTTSITLLNGETITNATDGTIALTGAMTVSGVSTFTGLGTFLGGATTTLLTLLNGEVISNATDGTIQLGGIASTTSITLLNGETITNATDGTITLGATNTVLVGTASTSAIRVGNGANASTINGLVFGYCTVADITITASTSAYKDCTGATGVISGDRVFIQATSSLPARVYVQSASSTATAGTIQIQLFNTGIDAGNVGASANSFNFWAVRD